MLFSLSDGINMPKSLQKIIHTWQVVFTTLPLVFFMYVMTYGIFNDISKYNIFLYILSVALFVSTLGLIASVIYTFRKIKDDKYINRYEIKYEELAGKEDFGSIVVFSLIVYTTLITIINQYFICAIPFLILIAGIASTFIIDNKILVDLTIRELKKR